ncbi:beta-1,4 N-acetylgalactosaminyltransferase 1-like [Branchiostoma floridae]|uniref:Beta-1,4 N-acetylgalactosaminyltransferase 1-like n=1 Tax=Branchiostoma floridae TaxID=7739 RepID=A0A9J7MDX6_BRAFL|nr:beta-1,4 N-acetylgalactosaminyltransferase 1-like [Branchiostoma floridae]
MSVLWRKMITGTSVLVAVNTLVVFIYLWRDARCPLNRREQAPAPWPPLRPCVFARDQAENRLSTIQRIQNDSRTPYDECVMVRKIRQDEQSIIPFVPREAFQQTLSRVAIQHSCNQNDATQPARIVFGSRWNEIRERRQVAKSRHNNRTLDFRDSGQYVESWSPLSYPASLRVSPGNITKLEGIRVAWLEEYVSDFWLKEVRLSCHHGSLVFSADVPDVTVTGDNSSDVTVASFSIHHLNRQLEFLHYHSVSEKTLATDEVHVQVGSYTATVTIRIQHFLMFHLYDHGEDKFVKDRVTVITKTYLRYSVLRKLIDSVNQYFPGIKIIVADDSDKFEELGDYKNVDHYKMPAQKGWFAGRNLALSQVSTEYFFWLDDDMVFTEKTGLKFMMNFLDETGYHIVGGRLEDSELTFAQRYDYVPSSTDDGGCLSRKEGSYRVIPGFPSCTSTDIVLNVFMGATQTVRAVGFEPNPVYARAAHSEFFADGLGKFRVASCTNVEVKHLGDTSNRSYNKARHTGGTLNYYKLKYIYFRNNLFNLLIK